MKISTITYIITSLLFLYGITIQKVLADEPATPDPQILKFPNILIVETGFKNTSQDAIVLQITDDFNNGKGANIKGLSIKDDSVFFTLDKETQMKTGEKIFISFKNETEELIHNADGLFINLKKSGLTGTTEQIVLISPKSEILNAICWTSSSPTETEIKELTNIYNNGGWVSQDINSCIESDKIANDQTIIRKGLINTKSKEDWEIKAEEQEEVEEEEELGKSVETDEGIEDETEEDEENICVEEILISEFLPNPEGKDTGNEWVEILNYSGADCSIYGWLIDDQEGGSKPYKIISKDIISSGGYMLLPSWQTKISLNNSDDSVRIFNDDEDLIDEVKYGKSTENKSYAINKENGEFYWTSIKTPLTENSFDVEEDTGEEDDDKDDDEGEKTSTDKSGKSINIQNGTLSSGLKITEIFPNPEGQDKGLEWIEIFNGSDESVKLGNWKIETSTKKYTFENKSINPGEYLVLYDTDLGFSIKNSDETFALKDFKNDEISIVEYEKVFEAQSFMEITNIDGESKELSWVWTDSPTPGEENHITYTYTGIVEEFDAKTGTLIILSGEEKLKIGVLISEENLFESAFIPGTEVKVTLKTNNDLYMLESYEIIKESDKKDASGGSNSLIYILLSSLPPIGFIGYSAIKKFGLIKIV